MLTFQALALHQSKQTSSSTARQAAQDNIALISEGLKFEMSASASHFVRARLERLTLETSPLESRISNLVPAFGGFN